MDVLAVLAIWVFLDPIILVKADAWLRENGYKNGFAGKVTLNVQQITKLQQDMGTDGQTGLAYVRVLRQGHGDMVHVPAGWMHMVINLRACLKMAWAVYMPQHFLNYVLSWQHIAS